MDRGDFGVARNFSELTAYLEKLEQHLKDQDARINWLEKQVEWLNGEQK